MGNKASMPSELPAANRHAVLNGDLSLGGIASKIKSGEIRKIVVMAGAGISVSAGIPDFRTKGIGLYDNLQGYGLPSPESIFEIDYFRKHPHAFFTLMREMVKPEATERIPTLAHFFSVLLQQKKLLVRHYTQNVDCLERAAGVDVENLVEAHGSFSDAHCIDCGSQYPIRWLRDELVERNRVFRCMRRRRGRPVSGGSDVSGQAGQSDGLRSKAADDLCADEEDVTAAVGATSSDDIEAIEGAVAEALEDALKDLNLDGYINRSPTSANRSPKPVDRTVRASQQTTTAASEQQMKGEEKETMFYPDESQHREDIGENAASPHGANNQSSRPTDASPSQADNAVRIVDGGRVGEVCNGLIKPDIVFFGESLPSRFGKLCSRDFPAADLLIILGTSLTVFPFANLVQDVGPYCPRLLLNNEPAGIDCGGIISTGMLRYNLSDNYRDVFVQDSCDNGVLALCKALGWDDEVRALRDAFCKSAASAGNDLWSRIANAQDVDPVKFVDPTLAKEKETSSSPSAST